MRFSDLQLSAFLDSELPAAEMEAIREALIDDQALADRLAELAAVDTLIANTYNAINDQPLPQSVTTLLTPPEGPGGKVIALALFGRAGRVLRHHAGLAAAVILGVGIGLGALLPLPEKETSWHRVSAVLDSTPSRETHSLGGGTSLTPTLTFRDRTGTYCRLYEVVADGGRREQLACRRERGWQLAATIYLPEGAGGNLYRPAAGGSALDPLIDKTIADGPYDRRQELSLIADKWQP